VPANRVEELQKAGLIAKKHNMTENDEKLLNSLTAAEVRTLINVKKKLGTRFLKKGAKDNTFPHPDSSSF
jgi:hypothetical protein